MTGFALLLGLALAAPAAWGHEEHAPAPRTQGAAVVPVPASGGTRNPREYFGESELVTQDGRKVHFYSDMLKDRVTVVNVIYTNCKDACPLITARLNEVRRELGELFGSRVFFVSISSDPERDTPQALKKFAQAQNADAAGWTFLTGTRPDIDRVLGKLGQAAQSAEDHSTLLLVMDVDAKRMRKVLPHVPPQLIAEHVRQIASAEKVRGPVGASGSVAK
jgi:protein SCO1/2